MPYKKPVKNMQGHKKDSYGRGFFCYTPVRMLVHMHAHTHLFTHISARKAMTQQPAATLRPTNPQQPQLASCKTQMRHDANCKQTTLGYPHLRVDVANIICLATSQLGSNHVSMLPASTRGEISSRQVISPSRGKIDDPVSVALPSCLAVSMMTTSCAPRQTGDHQQAI